MKKIRNSEIKYSAAFEDKAIDIIETLMGDVQNNNDDLKLMEDV